MMRHAIAVATDCVPYVSEEVSRHHNLMDPYNVTLPRLHMFVREAEAP